MSAKTSQKHCNTEFYLSRTHFVYYSLEFIKIFLHLTIPILYYFLVFIFFSPKVFQFIYVSILNRDSKLVCFLSVQYLCIVFSVFILVTLSTISMGLCQFYSSPSSIFLNHLLHTDSSSFFSLFIISTRHILGHLSFSIFFI